jgi:hypothetical protein
VILLPTDFTSLTTTRETVWTEETPKNSLSRMLRRKKEVNIIVKKKTIKKQQLITLIMRI